MKTPLLVIVGVAMATAVAVAAQSLFIGERQLETSLSRVEVYFSNHEEDPNSVFCDLTYPVVREVGAATDVTRAALEELLFGVTSEEAELGFFTNLNAGVTLDSFHIENGVASVKFSHNFQDGMAGSCRVMAVRSQITRTLRQFPSVKSVIIQVEGVRDEEILQP